MRGVEEREPETYGLYDDGSSDEDNDTDGIVVRLGIEMVEIEDA